MAGNIFRGIFNSNLGGDGSSVPDPASDNDFLIGSAGSWITKTLDQIKTLLGLGSAAYTASTDYAPTAHNHDSDYEPISDDFTAKVSAASETVAGKVELATAVEAAAGTDTDLAVTPSGVAAAIAAIPNTKTELVLAAATELTISFGAVTATQSVHLVDTQGDAETDDLDTINGGSDGQVLYIRNADPGRAVVVKHGTGNIGLGGADVTLASPYKWLPLIYDGSLSAWIILGGAGSGGSVDLSSPGPIGGTTPGTAAFTQVSVNGLIQWAHSASVADDGTVSLPEVTVSGIGKIVVGNDEERADFSVDASGNVSLWSYSANVAANADTDGKICIGTSVANPVVIKNRLGSAKTVLVTFQYK